MDVVGIDVGKHDLHVVLLQGDRTLRKSVGNNVTGFEQLEKWLKNRKCVKVHVCLEATGAYGIAIAEYLHDRSYSVSVVNPGQIKAFGRSELVRTKTDQVDAAIIARFCRANQPALWNPPPAHIRELRALIRRRETLTAMVTAEKNRLESVTTADVQRSIRSVLKGLQAELLRLEEDIDKHVGGHPDLRDQLDRLDEIPGFGMLTAMKVLVETNAFDVCKTSREIVAFAGLNPRLYQSGKIERRGHISKIGNAALRKALYYAALSAKNHSAYFRPFALRLAAAGKRPKVIITAIMRKLLILAHTLVRNGTRFDPAFGLT
ncbi:MAG: IS110 family transposase [Candidatus Eremiobacteraeota bacterium]|nr:IS110 family transposase [Candidatus Eremiobacteraeota bacterium]